jgi:glutamine synthetase
LQAAILAAGLDGIRNERDPGARCDFNMYTDGHLLDDVKRLPLNLLDALRALNGSQFVRDAFGAEFMAAYTKLRSIEWDAYSRQLTDWERQNTLDC